MKIEITEYTLNHFSIDEIANYIAHQNQIIFDKICPYKIVSEGEEKELINVNLDLLFTF